MSEVEIRAEKRRTDFKIALKSAIIGVLKNYAVAGSVSPSSPDGWSLYNALDDEVDKIHLIWFKRPKRIGVATTQVKE